MANKSSFLRLLPICYQRFQRWTPNSTPEFPESLHHLVRPHFPQVRWHCKPALRRDAHRLPISPPGTPHRKLDLRMAQIFANERKVQLEGRDLLLNLRPSIKSADKSSFLRSLPVHYQRYQHWTPNSTLEFFLTFDLGSLPFAVQPRAIPREILEIARPSQGAPWFRQGLDCGSPLPL